ncbi:TPA: AAA family ATPase, partial [Candidatus Woesearchaeota archaeon]|nr:AAA family ATPase [Candidatus Woesearchaeota archaeon]
METKIPSGTAVIDLLLDGGYEKDSVTCIYGPPGSGKTNLTLLCMVNSVLASKKKAVYVDTEGNFSIARFKQICPDAHKEALDHVIFLKPVTFQDQAKAIAKLHTIADERKIGIIIVDSMAMLYRLEFAKGRDSLDINRELSLQLAHLTEIARRKGIPI